jgi:cell division protein FtsQ
VNGDPKRVTPWRVVRGVSIIAALIAAIASPWWGRATFRHMTFFSVRRVEIEGARYLPPGEILSRLRVDTTISVWDDHSGLVRRLELHPQVARAEIVRKLPGTLVVRVTERRPVALVSTPGGFKAVDVDGRMLPVDPSRVDVDLPILAARDSVLLVLLDRIRDVSPGIFAKLSEVRRVGSTELLFQVATIAVRATSDISAERLADIIPVEADLARRQARVAELDLRYRDQVIARLQ